MGTTTDQMISEAGFYETAAQNLKYGTVTI